MQLQKKKKKEKRPQSLLCKCKTTNEEIATIISEQQSLILFPLVPQVTYLMFN